VNKHTACDGGRAPRKLYTVQRRAVRAVHTALSTVLNLNDTAS